jgi:hypothetical protein
MWAWQGLRTEFFHKVVCVKVRDYYFCFGSSMTMGCLLQTDYLSYLARSSRSCPEGGDQAVHFCAYRSPSLVQFIPNLILWGEYFRGHSVSLAAPSCIMEVVYFTIPVGWWPAPSDLYGDFCKVFGKTLVVLPTINHRSESTLTNASFKVESGVQLHLPRKSALVSP